MHCPHFNYVNHEPIYDGAWTHHAIEKYLEDQLDAKEKRDSDAKAALAAVIAVCPPVTAMGPVNFSSVRKKILKALGEGWKDEDGGTYLISPKGSRIYLQYTALDPVRISSNNQNHGDSQLEKAAYTRAQIPTIAAKIMKLVDAHKDLGDILKNVTGIEYSPWYIMAALVKRL